MIVYGVTADVSIARLFVAGIIPGIVLASLFTRVAQNRANHFQRNSGGQSGGRAAEYAEGFQSVFPRTVDEL